MCYPCSQCGCCGKPQVEVDVLCMKCGSRLPEGSLACPSCGFAAPLPPGTKSVVAAGFAFADAAEAEKSGEGDEAKRSEPSGGQGRGAQGEAIGDSEGDGNDLLWFAASLLSGGA